MFNAKHPVKVKESQYQQDFHDVCWEAIHDYREGCLCKTCFNYRFYREALAVVADVLVILLALKPSDNGDDGAEPEPTDPHLKSLHLFCKLTD